MKAVILAAGMGTRLGSLIPKPLSAVKNEKVIIDYQVKNLSKSIGIHNILVVVGYKKELIMERHPQLIYIYNNRYIQTNTSKSLLMALEKINDDVLWVNGDVFCDKEVINMLINSGRTSCLVDPNTCDHEAIKYTCFDDGNIKNISKDIENARGEALGINLILQKDLAKFKQELALVSDTAYFEKALENLTANQQLKLKPIDKGNYFCTEVDFQEDLEKVVHYVSSGVCDIREAPPKK